MMSKYIITLLIFITSITTLVAQQRAEKVEVIDMVQDLILTKKEGTNIKQVWWLPSEYWRFALADTPTIGEEVIIDIESKLKGYTLFSVVNSEINPFEGFKIKDATVTIVDNDAIYTPIPDEEIPGDIKELINLLRPTLAGMVGQLGEQMIFYVFKNEDKEGTSVISPYNSGKLHVNVNDESFIYRLPLQSMVKKKVCPQSQELLNGNWAYCPWHGTTLIEQK